MVAPNVKSKYNLAWALLDNINPPIVIAVPRNEHSRVAAEAVRGDPLVVPAATARQHQGPGHEANSAPPHRHTLIVPELDLCGPGAEVE
jgi:hypothetical protein